MNDRGIDEQSERARLLVEAWLAEKQSQVAVDRIWTRFSATGSTRATTRVIAPTQIAAPASPAAPEPWMRRGVVRFTVAATALVILALALRRPWSGPELAFASDSSVITVQGASRATPGAVVSVGGQVPATILYPPGIRLVAKPGASVEVMTLPVGAGVVRLKQRSGSVVYHQAPGSACRLALEVPGGTVEVTGTAFRLTVNENRTQLSVGHGTVRVTAPGVERPILVGGGHQLHLQDGGGPSAPEPFNAISDSDFADATVRSGAGR